MTNALAADFAWLRKLIREHVRCSCWTFAFGRKCISEPWCLRGEYNRRLSFMWQDLQAATRPPGGGTK
jgi:hypothetical protein